MFYYALLFQDRDTLVTLKTFSVDDLSATQGDYATSLRAGVLRFLNEVKPSRFSVVEFQQHEHQGKEIVIYYEVAKQ